MTAIMMGLTMLTACSNNSTTENNSTEDNGKISIVATLFPQYDFAREIAGDKADVKLLLPPGVESHSFEPTPADIVMIDKCDLFVYTGEYMEGWANDIVENISNKDAVLDVSKGIDLCEEEEEHNHSEDEEHDDHDHDHGGYDPHIWTSPVNAEKMVQNITDSLCLIDSENADYYKENAEKYISQLDEIDSEFKEIVANAKRKKMYFGGKFAMYYFTREYGLDYVSAYDSCSGETEPSAKVLAEMIDEMNNEKIPVVYYEELTDPKVARTISQETGAEPLLFHTCHNVTAEDLENGVSYISLMKQNEENLKKGLD